MRTLTCFFSRVLNAVGLAACIVATQSPPALSLDRTEVAFPALSVLKPRIVQDSNLGLVICAFTTAGVAQRRWFQGNWGSWGLLNWLPGTNLPITSPDQIGPSMPLRSSNHPPWQLQCPVAGATQLAVLFTSGTGSPGDVVWKVEEIPSQLGGSLRIPREFRAETSVSRTGTNWSLNGVKRINMFGWSDKDGSNPKRLIEYVWNGGTWSWGGKHEPPQDGLGVETDSMAVIHLPEDKRISVLCRADDGAIYEHYYTIKNGQWNGWFWDDLSVDR